MGAGVRAPIVILVRSVGVCWPCVAFLTSMPGWSQIVAILKGVCCANFDDGGAVGLIMELLQID